MSDIQQSTLNEDPALSEDSITPIAVMLDQRLSNGATRLYAVLDARLCGRPQRIRIETLAADLGWSRDSIERCAAELRAAGWLVTSRTGRSSSWHLVNPARQWLEESNT